MIGLRRIDAQNSDVGSILNTTLNGKAAEVAVKKVAGFASQLFHILAKSLNPIVASILPMAKIRFFGLSLVL